MNQGENGVISRANEAKTAHKYAAAKEKVSTQIEYFSDNNSQSIGKVNLEQTLLNVQRLNLEEVDYSNTKIVDDLLIVKFKDGEELRIVGIGKKQLNDLEFLRENLPGVTVSEDWVGQENLKINEAVINSEGCLYFKAENEILNKITYNGKDYTLIISEDEESGEPKITTVNLNAQETFKYGDLYQNTEEVNLFISINHNGDVNMSYGNESQNMSNFVRIYQNDIYIKQDEDSNMFWMLAGNVIDNGKKLIISIDETMTFVHSDIEPFEMPDYLFYKFGIADGDTIVEGGSKPNWSIYINNNKKGFLALSYEEGIIMPFPLMLVNINDFGTVIMGAPEGVSISGDPVLGMIVEDYSLKVTKTDISSSDGMEINTGDVLQTNPLPKFNSQTKTAFDIYETQKQVSFSGPYNLEASGILTYLINDGQCAIGVKYQDAYIILNSDGIKYSIDEENKKLTVDEIDSTLNKTGNTLEYTIGTDIFKK